MTQHLLQGRPGKSPAKKGIKDGKGYMEDQPSQGHPAEMPTR